MVRWFSVLLLALLLSAAAAQTPEVQPLTTTEQNAVDSIQQSAVQAAVSFLSSDEMAGRQTPSPELRIASRYVASRFGAAGLEPLASDETFFQTSDFAVSQPPRDIPTIQLMNGSAVKCFGYLWGANARQTLKGQLLDERQVKTAESPTCAVLEEVTLPPKARDQPSQALAVLARRVRPMVIDGVELVLMKCEPTSVWIDVRRQLLEMPIKDSATLQPGCAVVLVSASSHLADEEVTVNIAEQHKSTVPVRNVVGVLRGSDPELAAEAVLVSAHLDHIGTRSYGDDRINNGADDNASGVTAVLTLADAFAKLEPRPRRSLIFATFWGEEKGLMGSKAFVEKPLWPLGRIVANVNIEMVGRPEKDAREKIWMTGWKHSNLGSMMNTGAQRIGVEVFDRKDVGEMLYTRSDNASFVRGGVVGHSFSAGSLHSDYHQPTDEWEKLDLPHMTKVIQGLFSGVLHVANNDDRPK